MKAYKKSKNGLKISLKKKKVGEIKKKREVKKFNKKNPVGKTFKSRSILPIKPSYYRKIHLGNPKTIEKKESK